MKELICSFCNSKTTCFYITKDKKIMCECCLNKQVATGEMAYCYNCSNIIEKNEYRRIGKSKFCNCCYNSKHKLKSKEECEICHEICEQNNILVLNFGLTKSKVCKDCAIKEIVECCHCACLLNKKTAIVDHGGLYYCTGCHRKYIFECKGCSKKIDISLDPKEIVYQRPAEYEVFCEECCKTNIQRCDQCKERKNKKHLFPYDFSDGSKRNICNQCITIIYECNKCHKKISSETLTHEDKTFCRGCYESLFKRCTHCGRYRLKEEDDNTFCVRCIELILIREYGYKPIPNFHSCEDEEKSNLFIGVELEIMARNNSDRNKFVLDIFNNPPFFYFKRDGSINCAKGVEIVSHPATFKFHTESDVWERLYSSIKRNKLDDTNGCGLHFHVSRDGFKNQNAIRLLDYFVNIYSDDLAKIGGRPFGNYCRQVMKYSSDWGKKDSSSHSHCVNLTNTNTVEIRFCSSTPEYEEFMNRLKLIYNLVLFVNKNRKKEIENIEYESFEEFYKS